jgi:hypothetical protein
MNLKPVMVLHGSCILRSPEATADDRERCLQTGGMIVGIALSLYAFNVSPAERATRLYRHFNGECADFEDLVRILADKPAYAMTELALPTAAVYLRHALEAYRAEAEHRASYLR